MKKLLAIIILLSCPAFAGMRYGFSDPKIDAEFTNNYKEHDYPNWVNAKGSSATIKYMAVSTITVSQITASSATIGLATISSATISDLTYVSLHPSISGKLRQIVKGTITSQTTTTSSSFVDTNLNVTITPLDPGSTIYLDATFYTENTDGGTCFYTIANNTTNLGASNGMMRISNAAGGESEIDVPSSIVWADPPNTTSAVTYKVRFLSSGGANTCRVGAANLTNTFVAMEISP